MRSEYQGSGIERLAEAEGLGDLGLYGTDHIDSALAEQQTDPVDFEEVGNHA